MMRRHTLGSHAVAGLSMGGGEPLVVGLTAKQVRLTPIDTPGAHTWMVWRRNLAAFAPLLFK